MDTTRRATGRHDRARPAAHLHGHCFVAPDPKLLAQLNDQFDALVSEADAKGSMLSGLLRMREPRAPGLNDGMVRPPFRAGDASFAQADERQPLRGDLNVVVVLVDFEDKPFADDPTDRFHDLFFAEGDQAASVRSFYREASGGLVAVGGTVVGPYRMPQTLDFYADRSSGKSPIVKQLALDALHASDADVDFGRYDNDGDGYVDAFVVVHAGSGAEQTGRKDDIWSHKWTLPNDEAVETDGTAVFAYLTVPEDARLGVCAHELGHLLFGWPDLYDGDYSSAGLGGFCLMAGGSWNGDGDVPCHPSAWCKSTQGWVTVVNHVGPATVQFDDVARSRTVHRLWTKGARSQEYFLVENRRDTGFDRALPGTGLLVYHVDDAVDGNDNERHPQVALLQADGLDQLRQRRGVADGGDPYPGTAGNVTLDDRSNPNTRNYARKPTGVSLTEISADADTISARITT